MAIFNESHPLLKGFNDHYQNKIAPRLEHLEKDRKAAMRRGYMIGAPVLLIILVIAYNGFANDWQPKPGAYLIAIGLLAVGGYFAASWQLNKVKEGSSAFLAGSIATFLKLKYRQKPASNPISRFRSLSILPSYDRSTVEDEISGKVQDVGLHIVEAHLEDKRTRRDSDGNTETYYVTVFRGLLVQMDFPKKFNARTVISRDSGKLFNIFKSWGMKGDRVSLEDPEFERRFEVFSNDQVEARYLLTPAFMERVTALSRHFGSGLQLAFDRGQVYIAGPMNGDMFEAGSMFQDLTNPSHVREVLDEFGIIFDIIDCLNLAAKTKI